MGAVVDDAFQTLNNLDQRWHVGDLIQWRGLQLCQQCTALLLRDAIEDDLHAAQAPGAATVCICMSTERTLSTRGAPHRSWEGEMDNSFVEAGCAVMEVAALCGKGKLRPSDWRLSQPHFNAKQIVALAREWAFVEVKLAEAVIPASRSKTSVRSTTCAEDCS